MIYLGVPNLGGKIYDKHFSALLQASKKYKISSVQFSSLSFLPDNFNRFYCRALNLRSEGVSHLALLHDDVIPQESWWLDILMDEMKEHEADMISAIIPIKNNKGVTSTALDLNHYQPRRLTLKEIYKDYPPTFSREDLLLNTGCMLLDITKPFAEKLWFEFENKIVQNEKGEFIPLCVPEDWNFSRRLRELGGSLWATRKVKVWHAGQNLFGNDKPWGEWSRDEFPS